MCDETCAKIVGGVVGGIGGVIVICLAIFCFIRVSCPGVRRVGFGINKTNFQIRKKRAQSGVYSPEEKENKDYKQRNLQLSTISGQLSSPEPERLI